MADDRNNHRGFVRQPHGVGHSSPPPPAPGSGSDPGDPSSPRSVQKENSPPRGPRTLLLRRSENGYGFTLRHFIVYPPESCCMLPGHERTKIDEPMDTIFVKQVRANSPAAEAGLRTGDRVVSVDGTPTRGEQYVSVVQRIQQAGPWLRLLVVSKEDDILQRYFGETAHNPETNQRPRLRSPERLSQKQRRSISSMIPGESPRTRQSWVCSLPSSDSPNHHEETMCRMPPTAMSQVPIVEPQIASALQQQQQQQHQRRGLSEASAYDLSEESKVPERKLQLLDNIQPGGRLSQDSKYDLYDRTRPESVYSRPSNEQLYDRINDPIYERVRVNEHHPQHYYQPSLLRYPVSQAEPQVPIYRPIKRMVARRASEGSGNTLDSETTSYSSIDALRSSESSRLSIESRRDSSLAASKDSMSPYDSNSTLTGNECSDDSVIMNRLRKSVEQKAEFLRRPSHPIGWSIEPSSSLLPGFNQAVIQREFYARPQKLQRPIWPPGQNEQQRQQSPTRRSSQERTVVPKTVANLINKPSNQSVQRIKDVDSNSEYSKPRNDQQHEENQSVIGDHCYSSLSYDNELAKDQQYRGTSKGSFVSILSRIHENISMNQQQTLQETRNGSSSLPSSPGPDKKAGNDARFPMPQGLQIVSRRAKQFESGRLMSDEDEPAGDRTNLYKSELSRLSNKRSVPNVAVRKREFESKAENQDSRRIPTRETKSLDTGAVLTGNRIIPIGSKHIHCEPPADYKESKEMPTMEIESVRLRARSNSAESWEATNGPAVRSNARHTWQTAEEESNTEDNSKAYRNQENYLQSAKLQVAPVNGSSPNGSTNNAAVLRRQKNAQISDEDRATRRVSYLKATWGERMHVDSDLELSDSEPVLIHRSAHRRWRPPLFPSDITPLRRIFEDMTQAASLHRNSHHRNSIAVTHNTSNSCDGTAKDVEPVEREGTLHVKFTVLDGKRSTDRSWKQVWGVLRGPIIYFYKDRHSQSPSLSTESETNAGQSVDVRCSVVDVAEDYTKRKHVLRVANPTAEVLLQTEDAASMALWLRSLHSHAAAERASDTSCTSKQQAVPQAPTGPTTPNSGVPPSNIQRLSPLPSHKGIKKLTSFRNRSPTGQSPVNKTRKPSNQVVEPLPSPKSKTWKGRMAKQFRRMHGQTGGAPSSPTAQLPPEGATFKVPLELCPPSSFSECVPLIVEMCTSIVEARGLEVVGIYRVPGNTAAIAQLTDSVNRGFENINLQDPRWSDVNVISSLLKSFFRQLPDSLLTAELYPMFIDADKIEDPQRRMTTIRKLLRDLPEHHFETLKYLMQHLKKIVEHSEVNKMESKNLAIVFGPTLVRASGSRDNMVTMVTDMSHQCRIVESLLNNVDWFFSEDDLDDLSRLSVNLSLPTDSCEVEPASNTNHNLLLNNIQKIEGMRDMASARDIVSSIISAANKKMRRRKNQDEIDNSEHDSDKAKSKQESENSPTIRQSMALNERQCSVSEIVQMHESKSQPNHSTDRSLSVDANNSGSSHGTFSSNRTKFAIQSAPPSVDSTRLSIDTNLNSAETSSTVSSSASNQTKQSNDEIAILTYAGLSATTQERVRRFEEETKAMLQRDQHRQRLEAEKREEEKRRIEIEWQLAKREMENDDLLDSIVDTTVSPSLLSERLSDLNERLADKSNLMDLSEKHARSRSTTRPPLSIAVQQQPTIHQKVQATNQLTSILGEKMNNGVIKKFKTDKDPSMESICLPPVRYGSLDSLHEVHNLSQSSPSPSQQQRGVPGDGSDDGSDLLTSLTTTFDRKWRSLVNQSSNLAQPPPESTSCNKDDVTEQQEQKPNASPRFKYPSTEAYRDPSLHKSLDKSHLSRSKDDAPEKDTDSTVADDMSRPPESVTPNNDRGTNDKQRLETKSMTNHTTEKPAAGKMPDSSEKDEDQKDADEGDDCLHAGNPKHYELASEKSLQESKSENNDVSARVEDNSKSHHYETGDSSYSNKLKKFESLTNSQARSRLKRSESLNKRTCENTTSRLKRSESLNKHSTERLSPLKRSESLNKHSGDRSESPGSKLKRSESLTKTEKTECNISKRRQSVRKESATKLKRKNGMSERSIKRRHTVGSTKDFDKVHWLDNKLQSEAERVIRSDYRPKKSQLRTSSPDLSTNRVGMADTSFLIEVSFRGPSNVVFNVTNAARPQSLPDANLASKVFKVPLESHV
ncbi:rho GTPase-activating protein 21 isoform X1 [Pogonomyrmex barbatus]|uniref:Rho GTPase-activating protein 21 isoform X1 n=1 Tax=Pogonomyrmex barbatus TaxID=144034 RepID=A0A6I9WPK4_9HYME|nr:rho GTPase-activating protein 21 isoform X1 [Pogonomyrmex barbatus]